jgi:hypothetical protein
MKYELNVPYIGDTGIRKFKIILRYFNGRTYNCQYTFLDYPENWTTWDVPIDALELYKIRPLTKLERILK